MNEGAQVELVGHEVEVTLVFGLAGVEFLPVPFLEQLLGEGVAVGIALGVEAGAGIAVPIPGAAHATAVLKGLDGETHLPQAVQGIQTCDTRPDDQYVKCTNVLVLSGTAVGCLLQRTCHIPLLSRRIGESRYVQAKLILVECAYFNHILRLIHIPDSPLANPGLITGYGIPFSNWTRFANQICRSWSLSRYD